jgi:hypothetical protein
VAVTGEPVKRRSYSFSKSPAQMAQCYKYGDVYERTTMFVKRVGDVLCQIHKHVWGVAHRAQVNNECADIVNYRIRTSKLSAQTI